MLSLWQDVTILIATLTAALLYMAVLNRLWPHEKRSVNNDLIGWQLTIVGTTYAVILGFMLYTVWTAFGAAQLNSDLEANSLRNIYHLAEGLPEPQRTQLKQEARDYAETVISRDWPEMALDEVPEGSHALSQAMVHTVQQVKVDSPTTGVYLDHTFSALITLSEHRRTRILQVVYKLPAIFWAFSLWAGSSQSSPPRPSARVLQSCTPSRSHPSHCSLRWSCWPLATSIVPFRAGFTSTTTPSSALCNS